MLGWRSIGGSHPALQAHGAYRRRVPYAFTTLPRYQGLIAIIHRAVLTAGPIVTILALKPSWLRGLTSVSVAAAMTTICLMCKQSFTRVKRYPNKFCGPVCSMRWRSAQLKMKRRAANTARGRKVERQEATSLGEQVDVKW